MLFWQLRHFSKLVWKLQKHRSFQFSSLQKYVVCRLNYIKNSDEICMCGLNLLRISVRNDWFVVTWNWSVFKVFGKNLTIFELISCIYEGRISHLHKMVFFNKKIAQNSYDKRGKSWHRIRAVLFCEVLNWKKNTFTGVRNSHWFLLFSIHKLEAT